MKRFGNLSYRRKIFIGMVCASILPVVLYLLSMTTVFRVYSENSLKKEAQEIIKLSDEALSEGFLTIYDSIEKICKSHVIAKTLTSENVIENPYIYKQLNVIAKQNSHLAGFCIYDKDGNLVTFYGDAEYVAKKLAVDWGILYESNMMPQKCILRNAKDYRGTHKEEYVRAAKAIVNDTGEVIGFAVAATSYANIEKMLQNVGTEQRGIIRIYDDFLERIFSSGSVTDEEGFEKAIKQLLESGASDVLSESKDFRYYHLEDEIGLHLFYRQSYTIENALRRNILIFGLIAGVVSITISLFISGRFAKVFYSPIGKIRNAIDTISKGDYSARIDTEGENEDELKKLAENVNDMTATLEKNTKALVERERELGSISIKMMQAQLNPHFIYNTLDTIKWIGKSNDVPEVAMISQDLAKILRTSISSEQMVTLAQELKLVEAYANIQMIRFEDKFEFIVDIPEELLEIKVPKLILQPIIENSIVHGFEERDRGTILVGGYSDGESLRLEVRDDGCGIGKDELESINAYLKGSENDNTEDDKNNSIGVKNVNSIIRLHFGDEYGLTIESEYGIGTTVKYHLPMNS